MNDEELVVTLDIWGEFIETLQEAKENIDDYLALIDRAEKEQIKGNYSIKLTMFGLLLYKDICYQYISDIVKRVYQLIDKYKFQMLYGVTPELRKSIIAKCQVKSYSQNLTNSFIPVDKSLSLPFKKNRI